MNTNKRQISTKVGLPPGALVHVGKKWRDEIRLNILDYDADHFSELEIDRVEDCFPFKEKKTQSWINMDGLHNVEAISKVGNNFGLHPLLMEDILNTRHRPKAEEFDRCLFITMKMHGISKNGKSVISEQISFVLGDSWLISFQEQGDIFDSIRKRLREKIGNIRQMGVDYLLYRLIDTVVDHYFFVTEHFSDATEKLEEKVLESTNKQTLHEIQQLKKMLINFRKSVNPLREVVSFLQKDNSSFIKEGTIRYLRDVYEHIVHVNDSIDMQRDILANIMELYLSGESNKMNQIMKVLTIIATIFIPLTFIAGVYGMNFEHMPELKWQFGYYAVWILFFVIIILMLFFFRRKRWL